MPPEEEGRVVAELYRQSEARLKQGDVFYVLSGKYVVPRPCFSPFALFGVAGAMCDSMVVWVDRGVWGL